ncbi:arginine N-succinyltransferase, partial [Paraburkholderia sp. BR14261]
IVAAAGYAEPFYAFRNDALIHASRELHVNRKIHALTMSHELTGKSRLAGFYIEPTLRGDAAAHLMSRARMMYVAMNRRRFTPEVFSLLLGVTDETGASPFWEAVGRKFFGRDFKDIELASGGRSRTFIAEVMPAYPLYVPLLPEPAQRVLGEPDPSALLAYEIHLEEGFEPDRYVDIFDAGPVLECHIVDLRTVRDSVVVPVEIGEAHAEEGVRSLVSNTSLGDFRVGFAPGVVHDGVFTLGATEAAALNVAAGDPVRVLGPATKQKQG